MEVSLKIDNLDAQVVEYLRTEADRRGVDIGVVVNELLRSGLHGIARTDPDKTHHDLDALAGTWSDQEAESILSAVAEFRQIDEAVWK